MSKIFVTKTFLPPLEEYEKYLEHIWSDNQLTNQGPLIKKLEDKLKKYLNVKYLQIVTNGTLALQIALESLDINEGEIITTPFTYVATISSILWQKCIPVFVDINPKTLCIDPVKIEQAITKKTKAILPVHVFGNPCEVEKIKKIADKHNLKTIYDGAHAFGVKYKNKSLFNYGDISICSFHATKLFHTIEGGCLITNKKEIDQKIDLIKRFGHYGDNHLCLGLNAKASEFQAAMGLCNLKYVNKIIKLRKEKFKLYDKYLKNKFQTLQINQNIKPNFSYYPIILKTEKETLKIIKKLNDKQIYPRRYFYPSLNTLKYIKDKQKCPISEDISKRILCLPLYTDLKKEIIFKICKLMINTKSK